MIIILKYLHLAFIALAVLLFIFAFVQQLIREKALPVKAKKILLHTHLTIFLIGAVLVWAKQINPLIEENYWFLEKVLGFVAYSIMVFVALNKEKQKGLQVLAFLGAFGWLTFIMMLIHSHQAILLG